jgi:hypothetical protein
MKKEYVAYDSSKIFWGCAHSYDDSAGIFSLSGSMISLEGIYYNASGTL